MLFTDGLSDARDRSGARLGEPAVLDTIVRHRAEPTARILERVFEVVAAHSGDVPSLDDQTLVIVRS